ncbi:LUZP2 protein, partial [Phaetusa simplex]|nr:LUZP2 protein [Phaetusa simplex]
REEMKSLQEAFQKQLNEAAEKAEKQQATINFLKTEMERKSKMIRDLQNENKSLKTKLLSGNKLCGIHAEESKKIQAQLKELRYGKKDLIFKAQQLTDLEQKLAVAKDELEKAALDKVRSVTNSAKRTYKHIAQTFFPTLHVVTQILPVPTWTSMRKKKIWVTVPLLLQSIRNASAEKENLHVPSRKEENQSIQECDSQHVGKTCLGNRNNSTSRLKTAETETSFQKLRNPPWTKPEDKKSPERNEKKYEESVSTKEKKL